MMQYAGLIELVLVFGLVIAFYVWQMRDLKKAKEERAREAAKEAETGSEQTPDPKA